MRLATWNINGTKARLDFLIHWLRARKPDCVGLQELKLSDDKFPHEPFEAEGYKVVTHGQKSWNGVVILAREQPRLVQAGLPGQEELGARLITAEVSGLSFTSVYCPNGKSLDHADFARKLAWYDALAEHVAACHRSDGAAVLCGDFNICPAAIDSWNEEALRGSLFHTDAERTRVQTLLDWGFADMFRRVLPETQAFSWWDYRAGCFHKKQGLRIDLLLGTESVMKRVRRVEIDRDYRKKQEGLTPSDHAPVIVDLD